MANKQLYELPSQASPVGTDVVPSQPNAGGTTVKVSIAKFWDRANHTGTQLMATISDAGDCATLDVGTGSGTVAAGDHLHDDRYYTETEVDTALAGKSDTTHNHDGTYEPADAGIQTHIASTSNPHSVTAAQSGAEAGLGNPSVDGQVLSSTTGGSRSWITPEAGAKGGGTDEVFWENDTTVSTSYSITSGKNAMSAGPITIGSGATVTVPTGSTWTVV